jgi:hypothetical protein
MTCEEYDGEIFRPRALDQLIESTFETRPRGVCVE